MRRNRPETIDIQRIAAAILVILLSLGAVPRSRAYVALSTNGWDRFRWRAGAPVAWTYAPAGSDDVSLEALVGSLDAAFRSWAGVSCATLRFEAVGSADEAGDDRIHVVFVEQGWDMASGDAAAVAETFRDGDGRIVKAVIRFNGADLRWSTSGGDPTDALVADVQGVATHEIGHAVGLAHSRERRATMFFAGGESGNRHLDADDERGLCYLYPAAPFADGVSCDSCDAETQCADGICLYFPDEGGFCGQTCRDAGDCPARFACVDLEGIGRQCLPGNGHCDERGGAIPLGGYCYGDATCATGRCLSTPASAFCTQSCGVAPEEACPEGTECVRAGGEALCVSPGPLPFGAPCGSHAECESAYCVLGLGGGVCAARCRAGDPPCPDGAPCAAEACIPEGPRPLGAPCVSHFDCATRLCLVTREGAFCSTTCRMPDEPCPEGALCLDYGAEDFCRAIRGQPEGGFCGTVEWCDEGLVCRQGDATGDWSWCVRTCDPVFDTGCEPGRERCVWSPGLPDGEAPPGRCATWDGIGAGEACGPEAGACSPELLCVLAGFAAGTCARDCRTADGAPCGAEERCVDLEALEAPGRGVCVPDGSSEPPSVWRPGSLLPGAGEVVAAPEVAPALVPIEEASPPSSGGCAAIDPRRATPHRVIVLDTILLLALLCSLLARAGTGARGRPGKSPGRAPGRAPWSRSA